MSCMVPIWLKRVKPCKLPPFPNIGTMKYTLNHVKNEKGYRIVLIQSHNGIGQIVADLTLDYNWLVDHYGKMPINKYEPVDIKREV